MLRPRGATRRTMSEDWARPVVHWEIEPRIGAPEPGPGGHIRQGEQSRVTLYVQVRDLHASLDKAEALGGAVLAQPFDIPGGPTLAGVADPEGNPVMLVQQ